MFTVPALMLTLPAPLTVEPTPRLCVPPPKLSVVPAGTEMLPLPVPPALRLTVPVRISRVPVLLKGMLIVVATPVDLRKVPLLLML